MMSKMGTAGTAVAVCCLALASAGKAADGPRVVVSIKPVHSLVAGVMDGIGDPRLLIDGGGSPHTWSLRPSEARALQEADALFWIGEDLEAFLAKPLQTLPRGAAIVALHEADGVKLLAGREGGGWEAHDHDDASALADAHEHEHEDADDHGAAREHDGADMHIWLDPLNAQAMVISIATTLSAVDPHNAERYRANAAVVRQRLSVLDARLMDRLSSIQKNPYIVFHDAYRYFEDRYNLNAVGSITVTPEQQPGVQRLYQIRSRIIETGATCVFSEPQFEPVLVATIIEGTQARPGVLDPLGADLAAGPDAYFDLMDQLAGSLRRCLEGAG